MAVGGGLLRELKPGGAGLALLLLSGAAVGVGAVLGAAMAMDPKFKGGPAAGLSSGLGFLGFGPATALLAVASLIERRALPRAAARLLAAAAAAAGGLIMSVGMAAQTRDGPGAVAAGLCCFGVPALGLAIWGLTAAGQGLAALRAGTSDSQLEAVRALLQREGNASYADLEARAHLPEGGAPAALEALQRARRLDLELDPHAQVAWLRPWAAEARQRLPGVVHVAGRIGLDELGRELRAPAPLLRRLIQDCAAAGQLAGAVDWKRGVLFSTAAGALNQRPDCPSCGGRLTLAGQGLLRCPHCEAQIFLG